MSIHQQPPTKWVPLTDEFLDRLLVEYVAWIENLTEIRRRMAFLRDQYYAGWTPSAELQNRLADLQERDELYAAKHVSVARAFLNAAECDINATVQARTNRRTELIAAVVDLRRAWEGGWEKADEWTSDERNELIWLIYSNPELKSLIRISDQNIRYFCHKLQTFCNKRNSEAPPLAVRNPYRKSTGSNPYRRRMH